MKRPRNDTTAMTAQQSNCLPFYVRKMSEKKNNQLKCCVCCTQTVIERLLILFHIFSSLFRKKKMGLEQNEQIEIKEKINEKCLSIFPNKTKIKRNKRFGVAKENIRFHSVITPIIQNLLCLNLRSAFESRGGKRFTKLIRLQTLNIWIRFVWVRARAIVMMTND